MSKKVLEDYLQLAFNEAQSLHDRGEVQAPKIKSAIASAMVHVNQSLGLTMRNRVMATHGKNPLTQSIVSTGRTVEQNQLSRFGTVPPTDNLSIALKKRDALPAELRKRENERILKQSGATVPSNAEKRIKAAQDVKQIKTEAPNTGNGLVDKILGMTVHQIAKEYKGPIKTMLDNLGIAYPATANVMQMASLLKKDFKDRKVQMEQNATVDEAFTNDNKGTVGEEE